VLGKTFARRAAYGILLLAASLAVLIAALL
jgi:hypothetical protein